MDSLPVCKPADPSLEALFTVILEIFIKYEKQDRVTVPLLDVTGLLYESGTLSKLTNEKM
jgi:hypothetical protein